MVTYMLKERRKEEKREGDSQFLSFNSNTDPLLQSPHVGINKYVYIIQRITCLISLNIIYTYICIMLIQSRR